MPTAARRIEVKAADARKVREDACLDGYDEEMYSPGGAPDGRGALRLQGQGPAATSRPRRSSRRRRRSATASTSGASPSPTSSGRPTTRSRSSSPASRIPRRRRSCSAAPPSSSSRSPTTRTRRSTRCARSSRPAPADRSGLQLPLPEGGCWTGETIELPNGGSRASPRSSPPNTRAELEKLIQEKAAPLLDPQKNVIGIGEGHGRRQGAVQTALLPDLPAPREDRAHRRLHRRRRRRASTSRTRCSSGRPVVAFKMSAEGAAAHGEAHHREHAPPHGDRARRQGRDRAVHPGAHLRRTARSRSAPAGTSRPCSRRRTTSRSCSRPARSPRR